MADLILKNKQLHLKGRLVPSFGNHLCIIFVITNVHLVSHVAQNSTGEGEWVCIIEFLSLKKP